jgi:hypothetical protein
MAPFGAVGVGGAGGPLLLMAPQGALAKQASPPWSPCRAWPRLRGEARTRLRWRAAPGHMRLSRQSVLSVEWADLPMRCPTLAWQDTCPNSQQIKGVGK